MNRRIAWFVAMVAAGAVTAPFAALAAPVPPAADDTPPHKWEYQAVAFGDDEKEATLRLNKLARAGWEYVGPLGGRLVAFRRPDPTYPQRLTKFTLAKWQGGWESGEWTLSIKGDRWSWLKTGEKPTHRHEIKIVEVRADVTLADLTICDPDTPNDGKVVRAIFRLDGDTLHYCGTYEAARPTEFRSADGHALFEWKRAAKPD